MYEVGQFIVHPGQGVCRVDAIVEEPIAVYMLLPIGSRQPMKISFPVASSDKLRPVIEKDEAYMLIERYPDMQIVEYQGRSNALEEEHFKREIRNGTCENTMRIVKTFRSRIEETRAHNRKPPVVYERILKQASQRSLEELSCALVLPVDEVLLLFEKSEGDDQN